MDRSNGKPKVLNADIQVSLLDLTLLMTKQVNQNHFKKVWKDAHHPNLKTNSQHILDLGSLNVWIMCVNW